MRSPKSKKKCIYNHLRVFCVFHLGAKTMSSNKTQRRRLQVLLWHLNAQHSTAIHHEPCTFHEISQTQEAHCATRTREQQLKWNG